MELEHDIRAIPADDDFQAKVAQMQAEGWVAIPGVKPVVIYHVVRVKGVPADQQAAAVGASVTMKIDDTKIHVVGPDGKIKG